MTNELGMTLDEVIKKRVKEDKTGKFRQLTQPRKRRGGYRTRPLLPHSRSNNTSGKNSTNDKTPVDTRRRLKVENLNKTLQNPELNELFSKYGTLIRCGIHFDKVGKSTGIADVEFSNHEESEAAIKALDHADAGGEEMRVKYASPIGKGRGYSGSGGRKVGGLKNRRVARKVNRLNKRVRPLGGSATGRGKRRIVRKTGLRGNRIGGLRRGNRNMVTKRKVFTKTLGRKRVAKK